MSIDVSFYGLCCVVGRSPGTAVRVYLPNNRKKDEEHTATLAIPIADVKIGLKKEGFWEPAAVIHVNGVQVGCWFVPDGDEVEFGDDGAAPKWQHKDATIQFGDEHPKHPTRKDQDIKKLLNCAAIRIAGGTLNGEGLHEYPIRRPNQAPGLVLARRIVWTTEDTFVITSKEGSIPLKTADATLSVTNVGMNHSILDKHFAMYYTLLEGKVADPIEYEMPMPMVDVYDCVPPTGGS